MTNEFHLNFLETVESTNAHKNLQEKRWKILSSLKLKKLSEREAAH